MTILIISRTSDDYCTPRVEAALRARGADVYRFDTDRFPGEIRLTATDTRAATLIDGKRRIDLNTITALWYRRSEIGSGLPLDMDPALRAVAITEARLVFEDTLRSLPAFAIDPLSVHETAGRKQHQLHVAREVGLTVPRTAITNDPDAVRALAARCPQGLVTKMMHGFTIPSPEGTPASLFTSPVTPEDLAALEDGLALCPMTFQENIPKARELRVTLVGEHIWTAAIDSQSNADAKIDWRRQGAAMVAEWQPSPLPAPIEARIRALMTRLGLCYGAIDLIETPEGDHVFLEVNPGGEYFWLEDHCGFPISDAIAERLIRGRV